MTSPIEKAKRISCNLPILLFELETTFSSNKGISKQKKKGLGEEFWDFKGYQLGDPIKNIDWRKSAKQQNLVIKYNEIENSKRIWIWVDKNVSMNYRFNKKIETKLERATILSIILLDIFLRSGEKVGIVGSKVGIKNGNESFLDLSAAIVREKCNLSDKRIKKGDFVIFLSDFLDDPEKLRKKLISLSDSSYSGLLIQILDHSELTFPFRGRKQFYDPKSGLHKLLNRSEKMKLIFQNKIEMHNNKLENSCKKLGWKFIRNITNESYNSIMNKIYKNF